MHCVIHLAVTQTVCNMCTATLDHQQPTSKCHCK